MYDKDDDDIMLRYDYLAELEYIRSLMSDRYIEGRYKSQSDSQKNKLIFLAHSSQDKAFVRKVAHELVSFGYRVWFDENIIKAGDVIPIKISEGIHKSEYMIVFFSSHVEKSNWMSYEWSTMINNEINRNKTSVIPALIEKCEVPDILSAKRYVDFKKGFEESMIEILDAIGHEW